MCIMPHYHSGLNTHPTSQKQHILLISHPTHPGHATYQPENGTQEASMAYNHACDIKDIHITAYNLHGLIDVCFKAFSLI